MSGALEQLQPDALPNATIVSCRSRWKSNRDHHNLNTETRQVVLLFKTHTA